MLQRLEAAYMKQRAPLDGWLRALAANNGLPSGAGPGSDPNATRMADFLSVSAVLLSTNFGCPLSA